MWGFNGQKMWGFEVKMWGFEVKMYVGIQGTRCGDSMDMLAY